MIGKDEFGNLRLRERRKGGGEIVYCRMKLLLVCVVRKLVTDGFCFICEESCNSHQL